MSNIQSIVDDFANQLSALIEAQVVARARATVAAALGGQVKRGPGRPPKLESLVKLGLPAGLGAGPVTKLKKPRKKAPPQLCPVPGCKNRAAPIFGMVCSDHKGVPKAKIKQFREARRAKQNGVKRPGKASKK